jgi:hypothetical protein
LACGPSFIEPIFVFTSRPENAKAFAQGNIGIIQPEYYRSVLFVAYRELNGLPFSDEEQKLLVKDWDAEYELEDSNEPAKTAAINNWIASRKNVLATAKDPKINTDRSFNDSYDVFQNCNASAFDNAAKTLAARIAENSLSDANVKDWVQAQDSVFANCSGTKTIPEEAKQDAPVWLKNDRDYQIAAAYFYATNYAEAEKRFAAIAKNKSSPWHELSAYLLARVALRRASAVSSDASLDEKAQQVQRLAYYQQAENQLNSILADPSLSQFHGSAKQLLNLITFRTNPGKLHDPLAKKLLETAGEENFFQNLTDYRWLLDKVTEGGNPADAEKLLAKFREQSDLTDWIFTVQSDEKDAFGHAVSKWRASKSDAWLAASLMKAGKDAAELPELITASKEVARTSPAFLTVAYHLARLQMAQGQFDEPRNLLDSILSDGSLKMSISTANSFFSERLQLAQNLDEFVQFSQRHAAAFAYDGNNTQLVDLAEIPKEGEDYYKKDRPWLNRRMFDTDSTWVMNTQMPLALLEKVALHKNLADYLKPRLMVSAWTRAVLLNNEKTTLALAPGLMNCISGLKSYMPDFIKAKNSQARTFEASWIMLNNPAMRPVVDSGLERQAAFSEIDDYRDNWWCITEQPDNPGNSGAAELLVPGFISTAELAEAKAENADIFRLAASGSNYLAAEASAWATQKPSEKRLANALYLAVKATRYGCQNCETAKISKAAFDILKTRFGNTPWKKKTPYWFKDENCQTKQAQ